MPETVLQQRDSGVVTVVLNRPDRLNALTRDMWARLGAVFKDLATDDTVRCVILRGAGTRAFCPGADIGEFDAARSTATQAREYGDIIKQTLFAIADCPHPTVAMIHGPCTGGGLELAIMCDLRIAGKSGRFGIPINRIGVVLGYPEFGALLDLIGRGAALELLLEGEVWKAREAYEKGLVTRVVADGGLEEEVLHVADRIVHGAPLSNRLHKKLARRLADPAPLSEAEYDEPYTAVETEDYREGIRAFLENRVAAFRGK